MLDTLSNPPADDDRLTMAINTTDDADERAALVGHRDAERRETERRSAAELGRRRKSREPFRVARWKVIDRAVRDTGTEVADRVFTEYEVSADDVIRPVVKGYGVHREEWAPGDGWVSVPSIVRLPVARSVD
ncbi:hypothetical protein ACTXG7_02300 [Mycolicibacterium sp. Dal123E01]|uniref:hypothetical protein n=1 Tax=Mycolicibacterium sp. Dal123E01 TaxID=3457578 RepID=UPI00403E5EF7